MPRDLFGDVTGSSVRVGSHQWYTVPVSLVAHACAVAVLLVVPLLAVDALPAPDSITVWTSSAPPPREPPPPPVPVRPRNTQPEPSSSAAPVVSPHTIAPESGIEPGLVNTEPVLDAGVIGGGGTGLGTPPPPPPPAREAVRPGGLIAAPRKVVDVAPIYPAIALAAGVEGLVILEATIDVDGRVTGVRVLRSVALLDQAALDAVRQWQYTPTRLNGVPVPVVMTVTVNFTLNREHRPREDGFLNSEF
jgi:protein TonB